MSSGYRGLPSVDRVLSDGRVQELVARYSHAAVLELVRKLLEESRGAISDGSPAPDLEEVVAAAEERASSRWRRWPDPVINATGVILHTNLGRAPLSREALEAVEEASSGYSVLELDLRTGKRGSRQSYVAGLVCQLTGAQAALAVNNNASAVLLGLAAVASGKEVVVSRGEAVEIGGGFRIPDVLRQSGASLVEVGTTNRTYARDYQEAITEDTGAILAVHASNFRVSGFVHSPDVSELAALGTARGIPVLHDLGSGCLLDTTQFGLAHEPTPQESLRAGVSLTFFSGDKLLGGPQAGIIAGDAGLVEAAARHPLARAVRIDKLNTAALSATLVHYVKEEAVERVPVWRMMAASAGGLEARARRWASSAGKLSSVIGGRSTVGGGSLPGETLPTWLLAMDCSGLPGGAEGLAEGLRRGDPPVLGRIEDERVFLDPRTVPAEQDEALMGVVKGALSGRQV